ncbi:hypothetical protein [Croceimicrobium hydrocarbonivorans]|uniref:Lipoprotein SmpA/OmlA domain-containing protein n=1 Tax=Croceimicrobium hydrocarbonivorans TaxID=2761580 RepID=A0A7H0VG22_9FLAO|nr:hypothetical protein [Croceimicrobium hydrocarbonivorans]QNR24670.1 hypothetical protein H4K34_02165 [Croceimicrobium hydrocarbonivorans]
MDYTRYEIKASENIANCQRLQLGMTVEEVIEIMGKPESTRKLKKSIGVNYIEVNKYHYSTTLGASTGVDIYFSLESELVLKVDCL